VEQVTAGVTLRLLDGGKELARMKSPNGTKEPEILSFVSDSAGAFTLEVKGTDQNDQQGKYRIRIHQLRPATAEDARRVTIERLFVEGISAQNAKEPQGQAISQLEEALRGWQKLNDDQMTQITMHEIRRLKEDALTEEQRAQKKRALEMLDLADEVNPKEESNDPKAFQTALAKAQEAYRIIKGFNDLYVEPLFLFKIASLYSRRKERENKQEALKYFEQTLTAIKANQVITDDLRVCELLTNDRMGDIYVDLRMYQTALERFNRSLALYQDSESYAKAATLRKIGESQSHLKNYKAAERAFVEARKLYKELNQPLDQGVVEKDLGDLYSGQENKSAQAIESYLRAEALLGEIPREGDYGLIQVSNLVNLAREYEKIHEEDKAALYGNKFRQLAQSIESPLFQQGVKVEKAEQLEGLRKFEEAIGIYQEVLDAFAKTPSRDL
jgi:hypothetical protein